MLVCGHAWGIGVIHLPDGDEIYGIPWDGVKASQFDPDPECCTTEEFAAHAEALRIERGES